MCIARVQHVLINDTSGDFSKSLPGYCHILHATPVKNVAINNIRCGGGGGGGGGD